MGGHADRRAIYHSAVIHYDYVGIRQVFKLYIYTAIAPVPLSAFAGEPSQSVGKSFIKSYAAVCLEGAVIVLACIIFPCLLLLRLWSILMLRRLQWYGAISGSLCSICSSLSVRSKWQTVL